MKKELSQSSGGSIPAAVNSNQTGANEANGLNRRDFVKMAATGALAFSIVPRHVLGGTNFIAPSDKLTFAYVGCGTQGMREIQPLLAVPSIQIVAVLAANIGAEPVRRQSVS